MGGNQTLERSAIGTLAIAIGLLKPRIFDRKETKGLMPLSKMILATEITCRLVNIWVCENPPNKWINSAYSAYFPHIKSAHTACGCRACYWGSGFQALHFRKTSYSYSSARGGHSFQPCAATFCRPCHGD